MTGWTLLNEDFCSLEDRIKTVKSQAIGGLYLQHTADRALVENIENTCASKTNTNHVLEK